MEENNRKNRTEGCDISNNLNRSSHVRGNNRRTTEKRRGVSRNAGACLSADMDNEVHIMFRETLTEMKLVADPELYWSFVLYKT